MATTPDFAKMMQDAAEAFGLDQKKIREAMAGSAGFGEKLSRVAIGAAQESAELSEKYAKETLAKLGEIAKVKDAPGDYPSAMAEFLASQTQLMQNHLAAFADVARKAQSEAGQLMMTAAHSASADAAEAMQKAASGLMSAAEKLTPKK